MALSAAEQRYPHYPTPCRYCMPMLMVTFSIPVTGTSASRTHLLAVRPARLDGRCVGGGIRELPSPRTAPPHQGGGHVTQLIGNMRASIPTKYPRGVVDLLRKIHRREGKRRSLTLGARDALMHQRFLDTMRRLGRKVASIGKKFVHLPPPLRLPFCLLLAIFLDSLSTEHGPPSLVQALPDDLMQFVRVRITQQQNWR